MLMHTTAVLTLLPLQYYTIAVGKLNVAKLANFMEIDVYVLVACPEASLVDSQVCIVCGSCVHNV